MARCDWIFDSLLPSAIQAALQVPTLVLVPNAKQQIDPKTGRWQMPDPWDLAVEEVSAGFEPQIAYSCRDQNTVLVIDPGKSLSCLICR